MISVARGPTVLYPCVLYDCGPQNSGIKIPLAIALRPFLASDLGVTFQGMGHWAALGFLGSYTVIYEYQYIHTSHTQIIMMMMMMTMTMMMMVASSCPYFAILVLLTASWDTPERIELCADL